MTEARNLATALPLAGLLLFAAGCGCSRDEGEPAPEPRNPIEARMNDPAYIAALKKQETGLRAAMKAVDKARTALAEAEKAGAGAAELASLSNAVAAAIEDLKKNRAESQEIVRRQMARGEAENRKLKEAQAQKKENRK